MYIVLVRLMNDHKSPRQYVCRDSEDLFDFLSIFNASPKVDEFQVFFDGTLCFWDNFGWGSFDKWVKNWNYK